MHDNFDLRLEQMNKSSLLSNKKFIEGLLDILQSHVVCVDHVILCVYVFVCVSQHSQVVRASVLFDS